VLLTTLANVNFWSSRIALMFLQHALGLRLGCRRNQAAGGRINRNLAGAEHQVADAHGMIVGSDGGRRFGGLMMVFFGIKCGARSNGFERAGQGKVWKTE